MKKFFIGTSSNYCSISDGKPMNFVEACTIIIEYMFQQPIDSSNYWVYFYDDVTKKYVRIIRLSYLMSSDVKDLWWKINPKLTVLLLNNIKKENPLVVREQIQNLWDESELNKDDAIYRIIICCLDEYNAFYNYLDELYYGNTIYEYDNDIKEILSVFIFVAFTITKERNYNQKASIQGSTKLPSQPDNEPVLQWWAKY